MQCEQRASSGKPLPKYGCRNTNRTELNTNARHETHALRMVSGKPLSERDSTHRCHRKPTCVPLRLHVWGVNLAGDRFRTEHQSVHKAMSTMGIETGTAWTSGGK